MDQNEYLKIKYSKRENIKFVHAVSISIVSREKTKSSKNPGKFKLSSHMNKKKEKHLRKHSKNTAERRQHL